MKINHIYLMEQLNAAIDKEIAYANKLIKDCDFVDDENKCREVIEFIVLTRLTQLYTYDKHVAVEAELDELIEKAKKQLEDC